MNVAIFGAAGALGPVVAPQLLARGHQVRTVGRRRDQLAAIAGTEPFVADLTDEAQARAAAAGMDAVLYAVGVPYDRFELHPPMMRATLAGVRAAGVRRFVHISNVYVYGLPQTPQVAETHPLAAHTRKGRLRLEQEQLVSAAHDPGGLQALVLRPPDFYGPTAANSAPAYALAAGLAGKTADVLGPAERPHEYIFMPDLAAVVAELLDRPDAFGTAYNVAGGGTITTRDFIERLLRAAGIEPKIRIAGATVLRVMGLFNPIMRELVEMNYLQSTPVLLDDAKLRAVLPNIHVTPYDEGIRATVAAARDRELVGAAP